MKINPSGHLPPILPTQSQQQTNAASFEEVFKKTVDQSSPVQAAAVHSDAKLLENGRRLLDALDDYGKRLADPEISLKELSPWMQRVENAVSRLEESPPSDAGQELSGILDNARMAARVALMKYQRGDFV